MRFQVDLTVDDVNQTVSISEVRAEAETPLTTTQVESIITNEIIPALTYSEVRYYLPIEITETTATILYNTNFVYSNNQTTQTNSTINIESM